VSGAGNVYGDMTIYGKSLGVNETTEGAWLIREERVCLLVSYEEGKKLFRAQGYKSLHHPNLYQLANTIEFYTDALVITTYAEAVWAGNQWLCIRFYRILPALRVFETQSLS
jgi:hypothetical protein